MRVIRGPARVGRRTKHLIPHLRRGDFAVIDHVDLDGVAGAALQRAGVAAVLNASPCLSGRYPAQGALVLLRAGVPVVDCLGPDFLAAVDDGQKLEVRGDEVWCQGRLVGRGRRLVEDDVVRQLEAARSALPRLLADFVANTVAFADREAAALLAPLSRPPGLDLDVAGRPCLVVVRGPGYREDLAALRGFVRDARPVLIGVDGGADAIVEAGWRPDCVVGDMDSVSDHTLRVATHRVVHAYPDGAAPGLERVWRLGLTASVLPCPGTSEDVALLLAHDLGASAIVAVGTHTHLLDFLEKGRPGMGSTLLTRIKVGPSLIDAKGVSLLYRRRWDPALAVNLLLAALFPLGVLAAVVRPARQLVALWWLGLRLQLGL
ncbi:MAG: hypothetical protein IRY95_06320 [Clostridia bacterium]|nr:hypothetical protein [Clostridia bacterium]